MSQPTAAPVAVLLIEDSTLDAKVIEGQLSQSDSVQYQLTVASTLQQGLERLAATSYAVMLLDLNLPDSEGLETFLRVFRLAPEIPIVVVTAQDDRQLANNAVSAGAQDFLVKGRTDVDGLVTAIDFAMKRHSRMRRLNPHLAGLHRQSYTSRETADLITDNEKLTPPLREREPDTFERLFHRYEELLTAARDQRESKIVHNVSDELHGLAMFLVLSNGGTTDAQDIHRHALEGRCRTAPAENHQALFAEAQLLLMELLGYLVDLYRNAELLDASPPP